MPRTAMMIAPTTIAVVVGVPAAVVAVRVISSATVRRPITMPKVRSLLAGHRDQHSGQRSIAATMRRAAQAMVVDAKYLSMNIMDFKAGALTAAKALTAGALTAAKALTAGALTAAMLIACMLAT